MFTAINIVVLGDKTCFWRGKQIHGSQSFVYFVGKSSQLFCSTRMFAGIYFIDLKMVTKLAN